MAEESEETYAAAIGRNMWRLAKRRAFSVVNPRAEAAPITRVAYAAAPENKALPLSRKSPEDVGAIEPAPTTLREFLRKLAAELGSAGQNRDGS